MKFIFSVLILIIGISSLAQKSVSGFVFENENNIKEPVPGANIFWLGTTIGTSTDINGQFDLPWNKNNNKLIVSYVGFKTDTINIDKPNVNIEILLSQDQQLNEVIITARQPGAHISRLNPITTIEITGAELCKAACCSLAESFETNASVDVSYTDAATGAKQIQLLGLSGTYVQMLTENMSTSRGLASAFGLDFVPGPWMESIQVSKGAASVTNGYESLTGQINVQYKKPASAEKLFVNGFASSSGRVESNVNTGFNVGEKWRSAILAHASTDAQKNDHNLDGFLDEPVNKRITFMNRWDYRPNPQVFTQFGVKILDEERTGGQYNFNRNINPFNQEAYGIIVDSRNAEAYFKTGYTFTSDNEKSVALISNFTHHEQESLFGHRIFNATQNYFMGNIIFSSYISDADKHKYTTGINFTHDELSEELSGNLTNLIVPDGSRTETIYGAYFQYTYNLPEKLTLITGLRADNHNLYGTFLTPRTHVRYTLNDHFVFRASAGKGYRTPNVLSENSPILASSRFIRIDNDLKQEEGWNYGINMTNYIHLGNNEVTLNLEYYRTEFENQIIMDLDKSTNEVHFYNLTGKSISNVFQVEASMEIFRGMDVVAAWRLNDVKVTTNEILQRKPLQSKYKGMLNLSYATPLPRWQVDFTTQLNGGGRIPSTISNDTGFQKPNSFSPYQIHNAQLTRYFRMWNIYLGVENIGNFTQQNPIIDAQNPFGSNFDSSLIWGPLMGRKFYFGFRFSIDRT